MKYIFLTTIVLLLFSCKKTDNKKQSDYLQCKVNGKDWQSGCTTLFSNCEDINFDLERHSLIIDFHNGQGQSVTIGLFDSVTEIQSGKYFLSRKNGFINNSGEYYDFQSSSRYRFTTDEHHTGEVEIEIDDFNKTIKGNFHFVAKFQASEDSVVVSDGYFEGKYNAH